jgi:hypothetical protein
MTMAANGMLISREILRVGPHATGLVVPDRGRLRPEIWDAWRAVHRG